MEHDDTHAPSGAARTETCTPAERALLDAMTGDLELSHTCPICDYGGMGPRGLATAEALSRWLDELGTERAHYIKKWVEG